MTDAKGKEKKTREGEHEGDAGERKKREGETDPDEPVKEATAEDLSCPERYPPDAWDEKSDAAKRAYIAGIAESKRRTGAN